MNIAPSCPDTHEFDKGACVCIPRRLAKTQKATATAKPKPKTVKATAKPKTTPKTKPKTDCKPGKEKNANGRCVKIRTATATATATAKPKPKPKPKPKAKPNAKPKAKTVKATAKPKPTVKATAKATATAKPKTKPKTKPKMRSETACKPGKEKNANGRCVKIRTATAKPKTAKPKMAKPKPKPKPTVVIQNVGTLEERNLSKNIMEMVSNRQSPSEISKRVKTVRSFSPSINKRIVSLRENARIDIFQCGDGVQNYLTKGSTSIPRIWVGTDKNDADICTKMNTKRGREVLLHNIRNVTIDETQIIAPVQKHSNCWFNTFFVTFFISDKGRKFFRYFRELMITGKHADGANIDSTIAKSFLMLNICIEACYGNKNIALAMDTNRVIHNIYVAIPISQRYKERDGADFIRPTNEPGNPWSYYNAIMKFIGNDDLKCMKMFTGDYLAACLLNKRGRALKLDRLPDLIVFQFTEEGCQDLSDRNMSYRPELLIESKTGETTGRYQIDSAVVRDTQGNHFCALLTVNGKSYGFDGASHSRLAPFDWKPRLFTAQGVNSSWRFDGSVFDNNPSRPIEWSFSNAYHLLFYYRVK